MGIIFKFYFETIILKAMPLKNKKKNEVISSSSQDLPNVPTAKQYKGWSKYLKGIKGQNASSLSCLNFKSKKTPLEYPPNQTTKQCNLWCKEQSFGGRVTYLQIPALPLTTWGTFLCLIFPMCKVGLVIPVLSKFLCGVRDNAH